MSGSFYEYTVHLRTRRSPVKLVRMSPLDIREGSFILLEAGKGGAPSMVRVLAVVLNEDRRQLQTAAYDILAEFVPGVRRVSDLWKLVPDSGGRDTNHEEACRHCGRWVDPKDPRMVMLNVPELCFACHRANSPYHTGLGA